MRGSKGAADEEQRAQDGGCVLHNERIQSNQCTNEWKVDSVARRGNEDVQRKKVNTDE